MNVTRDEAQARARLLDVTSYDVQLDLTEGQVTFGSDTTASFACTEPGSSTFVDLVAEEIHEITLNGRTLDPAAAYDGARIALTDLAADNQLTVRARCRYMNTGEGLHRFVDPVDKSVYLYTQFEVADARRMFTAFDQPDLKATFTFTVTAPADWQVVSNQPTPEPEPVGLGNATWRFAPTERRPSSRPVERHRRHQRPTPPSITSVTGLPAPPRTPGPRRASSPTAHTAFRKVSSRGSPSCPGTGSTRSSAGWRSTSSAGTASTAQ